eukprot:COSAG02_NODE_218_length_28570_cov_75.594816_10_plen_568_part_00
MAKKRTKAMTRDTMIALLRTRGVKGRLSKMTKPQLKRMVDSTAPPSMTESAPMASDRPKGDLELEPDDQSGGHYFQSFGKASASEMRKYKHTHEKDDMPTVNVQKGSGHSYRDFVAAQMRQNGGNMKAAVAKYREMKGGHMVLADGTISDKENAKYRHRHKNLPNPAKKPSNPPERTASPDDDIPELDDAFEPPQSPSKAAPKAKATPKKSKPATRSTTKVSSIFDTEKERAAKAKAQRDKAKQKESASWQRANRRAARDAEENRRAEANIAARRAQTNERKEALEKRRRDAQSRLDEGTASNPWERFRDRMYASGNFDMKDISDRWKKQKERMEKEARDAQDQADDLAFAQQEFEEDQAERREATAPIREAARRSGRIAKKQTGDGYDMHGSGYDMHGSGYDMHGSGNIEQDGEGIMDWLRKHPVTEDIVLGSIGAAATVATGGLADAALGVVGPAVEGLTAATEGVEESALPEALKSGVRSVTDTAKGLYAKLPDRTEVAKGIAASAGERIFGDEEKDAGVDDDDTPTPSPAPDPSAAVRSEYNSNYASLFGHLHDQPYTGSIWG